MKTYAETIGVSPIDWDACLQKLIDGEATQEELKIADQSSGSWETDPGANLSNAIPRDIDGSPFDRKLISECLTFHTNVYFRDYFHARDTLARIKQRGAELLLEIQGKEASND